MNKREFLRTGLVGFIGLTTIPAFARNSFNPAKTFVNIPRLGYSFESLSDFLSKETLLNHFNVFIKSAHNLKNTLDFSLNKQQKVAQILLSPEKFDKETIRQAAFYLNHKIFFRFLSPENNAVPDSKVNHAFISDFGGFEQFKSSFIKKSSEAKSGWVWLAYRNNKLFITTTDKNDNPLSKSLKEENRGFPLFGLDLHEHAYSPDYKDNKEAYASGFLNHINWTMIENRFSRAKKFKF